MEQRNSTKKKILITIGVAILAIIAIIGIAIMSNSGKLSEKGEKVNSAELARAMTYDQVQEGEEAVEGTENIKFDAFFLRDLDGDGYAESLRGTCKEIGSQDTIYMELNVQTEGYLKDAKITIGGKNFYLQTALPKDQELKESYIGSNIKEIAFNNLNNGTQKLITGIVRSGDYSYSSGKASAIGNNINNYSQVNSVTLTGTYVDENGNETPITKTVEFNIDWYGTTTSRIYTTNQTGNINTAVNEEEGVVNLGFTVYTEETNQKLILKSNHVEGEIPELNGYAPIDVVYTGSNATFNYDEETRKFTLDRTAIAEEDGKISSSLSRQNSYGIRAIYPIEAYQSLGTETVQLKVPVSTYYEGFNNQNKEFKNPYKSNTAKSTILAYYSAPAPQTYSTSFDIKVGKYIYEPAHRYVVSKQKPLRIYNGESEEEKNDTYTVMWKGLIGTNANTTGMVMQEEAGISDTFIKTDSSVESAEEVVTNVGIYFSGADQMLGDEGWIKVYDNETGDLLETFTKDTWNKYTSGNPYKYTLPVKHIRIETSEIVKKEVYFYAYNIKEIDDEKITTKYEREQFDELQYIKSTLTGNIAGETGVTTRHTANYEAPVSVANISISQNTISTQGTEKNDKITITTKTSEANNQVKWQNGIFLVKLPAEIIDVQLKDVTINNSSVNIESYEVIEDKTGRFIKIVTKNDTPQEYAITLTVDLSADPRIATTSKSIELYATNENGSDYYYKAEDSYDVNNNLNTTELVNHTSASLSMVSPNSLLTNQTATNYDDKESIVVSPQIADLKPQYAVIDQEQEEQTATIGTQIKNNYASTISDIKILGKIPFEGNTYVISGADLNSSFTTKMTDQGIIVPEELQGIAKVYYSENENPNTFVWLSSNNWKSAEEVENWDNVKTFLIDLGNYVMPTGKDFVFNYTVKVPNGIDFNQVSYSHHGVYFSLDTENGKYKTKVEPNKLGFRIAEKYDLELTKYQTGKDKLVPGATYSFKEIMQDEDGYEIDGEAKTGVTNADGILRLTNLYAEREYEIREIKVPDDYELNEDVVRFIGHVNKTTGELTIEKKQGTTREEITVVKNEGENYKLEVKVEDEAKAKLKITKVEQGTDTRVSKVKYKLTGKGFPESGRTVTTNTNGEIQLKGLSINEEYTLEEVKAEGYYLASQIKFKVVNNDGEYTAEVIEGTIKENTITEEDSIPTVNMTLEDEKIPTYDLELVKIQKKTNVELSETEENENENTEETVYLAGAKFKLYKGTKEIGEYITDENGRITISGLYQYETEKDLDQTYILKEVLAPEGYAKVKDITFKVENVDGTLQFIEELQEGQTAKQYTAEGNKVVVTVEDSPSFRLVKKDAETGELLANVKFAIYNVDEGEQPARNSKGEILGRKETINGKEYYTLSTNESGEITADLQEGLYKAVEVEAPDKYDLKENEYYFGIGASREGKTAYQTEWAKGIGGNDGDCISTVAETSDGGYIAGGYFNSSLDLGNGVVLTSKGSSDGMIIKYSSEGEVEWAKGIGGSNIDQIKSIAETADGGIIAGGHFFSSSIDLENGVTLTNKSSSSKSDGIIIKYSEDGEIEWTKMINAKGNDQITDISVTKDGGFILGGRFSSDNVDLGNGVTLTKKSSSANDHDGMIIKYSSEGEVEWAQSIGGSNDNTINAVAEASDGGYAVVGHFIGTINLENGIELNTVNNNWNGMIIKYSSEGKVEWAQSRSDVNQSELCSVATTSTGEIIVGGSYGKIINYTAEGKEKWKKGFIGSNGDTITSLAETADGGIIAGGYSRSRNIDLGNGIVLTNKGNINGIIIKYDSNDEVEWAKGIGGSSYDYVISVAETADGGIIIGGHFQSSSIDLENGVVLTNKGTSNSDGMIIKYEKIQVPEVVVKQAKGIGGSNIDRVKSISETSDGGYIVGGEFISRSIDLGNGITLSGTSTTDGMIIKYDRNGKVEWAKEITGNYDSSIESVSETSDGGYIVGGEFKSSIDLGKGVVLTNKNSGSYDGMIIKYDRNGELEWAKGIGGTDADYIYSIAETADGGIIAGGYFYSSSINLGNGIVLTNKGTPTTDGMIIKLSSKGEVKWAKGIGDSGYDSIYSVAETTDGDYIVGGHFQSRSVNLGNGVVLNNNYTGSSGSASDGMIIKYSSKGEVEWAKGIGGSGFDSDVINAVTETSDGGYIAGGYFKNSIGLENGEVLTSKGNKDGMIIKYNSKGEVEWAKGVGGSNNDEIKSVAETTDGGIIVGGCFAGTRIDLGNGVTLTKSYSNDSDGMIIKYSSEGEVEWAKGIGGSNNDEIKSVAETTDGGIIAGGSFSGSSSIDLGNGITLTNKSTMASNYSDGMIIKIAEEMGVPEVEELVVENTRKEFKITTDVKEIDNIKGGTISGEDWVPYEKVKYGDNNTKEIIMVPDENYEIISITVNGEEYQYEVNEDGTYTMPIFENITEDKHIVVTYSYKDNKITLNKIDSITKEHIIGAKFKLDQIEERLEPENVIGELTANGVIYDTVDAENQETIEGSLTDNGQEYAEANITNEITDVSGELTNNGTYYFVEQDGKYVPTNSKTYQIENGGTTGKHSTTANSYIPIDLTGKEGKYAVVVNANVSSEGADYGYATITENTTAPTYSNATGRFVYISGTVAEKDYTSTILEGGKIYYLHLGYRKDGSVDTGNDQIVFNSIKVYEATEVTKTYNFEENDGKYIPTNLSAPNRIANSYIPIDLTGKEGKYAVVVNAETNYTGGTGYLYATVTENTNRVTYSTSTGRFVYLTSTTNAKDYVTYLEGGKIYYLHLGYQNGTGTPTNVLINNIKLYSATTVTYNFIENDGKYESNNQEQDGTVANSYIPIDLTGQVGKYNLTVNAEIVSQSSYDYGYATVTENTTRPAYNTTTGRFIYISGTQTAKDYNTVLDGGKMYYLHIGYYKNASTSFGDDKFTINSVDVTLNDSELYHTEVETNSEGKAITQIPFGKYEVTEIETPDGYWPLEEPITIEFRADGVHEFDIENERKGKVTVHHYIKGTTTKVAEDEVEYYRADDEYKTLPKIDLEKYELELDKNGEPIIPSNSYGIFEGEDIEVIYYYVDKAIPLVVKHYIEGTSTPVPLKDGNVAEDEMYKGQEGEEYTTSSKTDVDWKYELVEEPENKNGTYEYSDVCVTYYYKLKDYDITTEITEHEEVNQAGETVLVKGGTISGEGLSSYENVVIDENSTKDIIVQADEGYKIKSLKVQKIDEDGEIIEENIELEEDTRTYTLDQFNNVITDIKVIAEFEKVQGTVTVHHYIKDTTTKVPLNDGTEAEDEQSSGYIGDIYVTKAHEDTTAKYKLVAEPENASGEYIDGNIEVIYYYEAIPAKVTVHHYIENTEEKVPLKDGNKAEDEIIDGYVTDEYTTGVADVDNKYELVEVPANANGEMTEDEIVVIYYYRVKDTSVLVHHYIEGTETKLSEDVLIEGKVDDEYTTSKATDIPSKYELIEVPENAEGTMTVEQTVVTYYYRLKETGVIVHHYKEGTTESLSNDVTITGRVDDEYKTSEATDIPSAYELVAIPENAEGIMTEAKIVVIYYYRPKETSVLVHHYIEGTETKLSEDVTIDGRVFDEYETEQATDIPGKYELVAEPENKTGNMTEEQIVVTYYYRLKDTSVIVHHYIEGTETKLSEDVLIEGQVDDDYTTSEAIDIPNKYELVEVPENAYGTMTVEQTVVTYYYRLKDTSVLVHHYIEGTETKLADDILTTGQVDDMYVTGVSPDVPSKYEVVAIPENAQGTMTVEQTVVTYYYRLKDTSVLVHHYIKNTETKLSEDVTIEGQVDDEYNTTVANDIPDYYELVEEPENKIGTMVEEQTVVTYYYQLKKYPYVVNYLEIGTNEVLHDHKEGPEYTYGVEINANTEKITIEGYVFDSFDKEILTISNGENVINIYYRKRNDLSYKVNYLEKDTNKVLHEQKDQDGVTFEQVITSSNEVIEIDGYNYDSVDKETLTITTGENVINVYYVKRNDLSYTVNYLEKDTDKILSTQKTQDGMIFEDVVTSSNEVIDIDGYNYDSVDKETLTITTGENIINIYYVKRNDLSYTVNYLEKDTDIVINIPKVQDGVTFEDVITSSDKVIEIDGYNYDSVDKETLTITTGENVINIYYTKRNDLSYTVNYLEKDTDKVLHEQKTQDGMTFEDVVNTSDEIIEIDGYNYDSADKSKLLITTGENVINIYYTKRNDLSYTVNYLEKDTEKVLHEPKTQDGMIFEDVVNTSDEIIEIDGYNYDSVDKETLTITTGENVVNIYYVKRNDLSYTVNYLEKDTDKILHEPKVQEDMTFEDVIISSDEVIEIDGYNYDSVDKEELIITTGKNVINIYYVKRNDLTYTVNYLEKDTEKVLHEQKTQDGMTFEDVVNSSDEVIEIDGYNYDSVDKETLAITTGENVINIYYVKRNDLSYTVNYLEKDTNKVLKDQKVTDGMTFEDVVTSSDEVVDIYGYDFDSADKETLTITTSDNVINLYYTKKATSVLVHHYAEGTETKVAQDVLIEGKVSDDYTTTIAEDLPSKYELVGEPTNKVGTMTEDQIVVIYYYKLKSTKVIVHHYEEGTTNKLSEDVEIEGLIDSEYTTEVATDIPIKYVLTQRPANATGIMTEEVIEVTYYYVVRDAVLNIYYLEKGTDIELAKPEQQNGKVGENYRTDAKEIEGYTLVEHTGNTTGQLEVEPLTVIYYYLQNTKATVQYIDKTTGEILDERTDTGLVGDEFVTETKTFENYILVEEPEEKTVNMTKDEIVLKYYYIHISGGVIEEHIDVISGDVLYNNACEGNEGDEYSIPSRNFTGYDLVEDRLPDNAEGTMTVTPIRVTYYYIYRTKVTTKYIDKTTGEPLTEDEIEEGHEGDYYTTENKDFEGYKLVQVPDNSNGQMTKEDITVIYYYVPESAGVIERHLDVLTNEEVAPERTYTGYAEDPYETSERQITGYDLVKEKYPENAKGKMTKEEIVVTYYYSRRTQVQVKYVDKITGQEIATPEVIEGHQGDDYTTEEKEIPGYDLIEVPTNKKGTMTDEVIEVIYYYVRPAKVITNYYDIDTKETIAAEEIAEGHENDEYTTVQKEIKYYNLVEIPVNAQGNMTVEDTRVDYYYKKKTFNLKVEKQVKEIAYNNQVLSINGDIGKLELNKNNVATADVKVTYEIKVMNTGELKGGAELIENIPNGMTMSEADNKDWVIHEDTAILSVDDIEAGQERAYTVVMRWTPSESNLGMKENIAQIVKVDNEAGFEEITIEDNEDKADLVISIQTGSEDDNTIVKLAILAIFAILGITVTFVIKKEKNK